MKWQWKPKHPTCNHVMECPARGRCFSYFLTALKESNIIKQSKWCFSLNENIENIKMTFPLISIVPGHLRAFPQSWVVLPKSLGTSRHHFSHGSLLPHNVTERICRWIDECKMKICKIWMWKQPPIIQINTNQYLIHDLHFQDLVSL